MAVLHPIGIVDIEVVAVVFDRLGCDFPGQLTLFTVVPPGFLQIEFLDTDRLGFGIGLVAVRVGMLEVPDVRGGNALGEEKDVGLDGGVWGEDSLGKFDDGVKVALVHEPLFDAGGDAVAEEGSVRENNSSSAAGLEEMDDEIEEEIGCLGGAEGGREVGVDAVFFFSTEGGIGDDDIYPVLGAVVAGGTGQGVVVADVGRNLDTVKQHVSDGEKVRERLLLDASDAFLEGLLVGSAVNLFGSNCVDGGSEEAAGAAGGIKDGLTELDIDHVHDELGDTSGRVKLPGVACGLEILENRFVDIAEEVAVLRRIEVDFVEGIDDLAEQSSVLHEVVGVFENGADNTGHGVRGGDG